MELFTLSLFYILPLSLSICHYFTLSYFHTPTWHLKQRGWKSLPRASSLGDFVIFHFHFLTIFTFAFWHFPLSLSICHHFTLSNFHTLSVVTTHLTLEAERMKIFAKSAKSWSFSPYQFLTFSTFTFHLPSFHPFKLSYTFTTTSKFIPDTWSREDESLCQEREVLELNFLQPLAILPPWKFPALMVCNFLKKRKKHNGHFQKQSNIACVRKCAVSMPEIILHIEHYHGRSQIKATVYILWHILWKSPTRMRCTVQHVSSDNPERDRVLKHVKAYLSERDCAAYLIFLIPIGWK